MPCRGPYSTNRAMDTFSLYFDIGNTNTKIGLRLSGGPVQTYSLPSDARTTSDQLGLTVLQLLAHAGLEVKNLECCLASSVVPNMSSLIGKMCERYLLRELLHVPGDVPVPLENRYSRPYEVGADRLVGAYGARSLFPESPALITIDFGTATTFDCIEGDAYLGGLICPGVLSSAAALAGATAKLPHITLEVEETTLKPGLSTATSLSHGFLFGFASMTEGLVERLSKQMRGPVIVIGTGGFAKSIARVSSCFDLVWTDLVLEGLAKIHDGMEK